MKNQLRIVNQEWTETVPSCWKKVPLKNKFSFNKGLSITKSDLAESGFPIISYGQIHSKTCSGVSVSDDLIRYVPIELMVGGENSVAKDGDVIFADTSEDLDGCGNAIHIDTNYPVSAGYHTILLKRKSDDNSKYFAYLFRTDMWRKQIREQLTDVKVFSVSQGVLKETYLIIPSKEEQDAIVSYLDATCAKIDEAISRHKQIIEKLEEYRKVTITQAVTKGLDSNRKMCYSGVEWIGEIPEHWNVRHLKRVAKIGTGNTPSKKEGCDFFSSTEGIPWIKAENLESLEPIHSTEEYLNDAGSQEGRVFPPYTVYVCCIASVGKVGFSDIPASCNQQINAVQFIKTEYYWKYGFYMMKAASEEHIAKANTSVQLILNGTQQKFIKIPVPPLEEQKTISSFLDSVCETVRVSVDRHISVIEKLEEYRKSMIYNAVTGKTKV